MRELIDGLPAEQEICLIAFGEDARAGSRLSPTISASCASRSMRSRSRMCPSDLEEALRMAQALARTRGVRQGAAFLRRQFSRAHELRAAVQDRLPARSHPPGSNYGITACNARRAPGGQWEVFVQLAGSADAESDDRHASSSAAGWRDRRHRERARCAKGGSPRLVFKVAERTGRAASDARLASSAASIRSPRTIARGSRCRPTRPLAVYVPALAHQLPARARRRSTASSLFPRRERRSARGFDLVITDDEADLALPARVTLLHRSHSAEACESSSRVETAQCAAHRLAARLAAAPARAA